MLMRVLRVHFRFRSPSWISGHVTSGSHVTSGTGRSHVTGNPRWRPEPEMDPQNPHEHQVNLHMVGQKWWEEKPEPEVGKWSEKEVRTPDLWFLLDKFLFIWAPLWLTWGQLLVQKSNWTGLPNYTKCEDKVTISPGRPKTMWPGDRRAVGCGRHLGTWWPCS